MLTPDLVHLRQLCRLEISGALLASVLFQELKNVVACDAMTLLWWEPQASAARLFHESETEVGCGFIDASSFDALCSATQAGLCVELTPEHLLMRAIGRLLPGVNGFEACSLQSLLVCFSAAGTRVGALLLHRPGAQAFSTMEKAALVRLSPALVSALGVKTEHPQWVASEHNAGMLLLDHSMNIQYACRRGRKLIQLAQAPLGSAPRTASDSNLAQRLRLHLGAEHLDHAPKFVVHNCWGSFEFLLHRLSDTGINPDQLTAVAVRRQEPLALNVLRGCRKLALSEKQTEIALLLIKGLSYDQVATKLLIRATTVADHVRKIYDKVGVSNRSELVTTLLLGNKNTSAGWPLQSGDGQQFRLSTANNVYLDARRNGVTRGDAV